LKIIIRYITRTPYNAVSAWLPNIFPVYCVKMSADDRGIHNTSCENRTPCVFPNQVWHQLIFTEAVSTVTRYTMLT